MTNKNKTTDVEKGVVEGKNPLFDVPMRYLNPDAARGEVLQTLAQLELDIHKLGIQATLTGVGEDHVLQNGMTIAEAVRTTRGRIVKIEATYHDILAR